MALNHQLGASILSAKNENILTLANANIDFALIKVEVPKQFEGLGKSLSKHRRDNAECGQQHKTARRLGALFDQVIPDNIGSLTATYGERVSEIATSSKFDLKATEYGPFSGHVGIDGTSIYAAASSGSSVIAMHLLACMLARMFSNAEATAIWVELVEYRIKELERNAEASQIQGFSMLLAAQQGHQIMRDDLAAWDTSARAWLEAANQIKRREDTQLKLIIKNIPSIKSSGTTYKDVVDNWVVAMTTIQKSIEGVPQDISNGAVLLGLRSWHIYPDLNVFAPVRHIPFNDPLVKAEGIITLGLEQKGHGVAGVSWSISLSHMRFYGDPVVIDRSSGEDSDRVTAQELRFVTFGCLLSSWINPETVDIVEAAECFVALGEYLALGNDTETSYNSDLGWLIPLISAAQSFLSSANNDRTNALYLIEFGRRQGRNFLDENFRTDIPMFGLANPFQLFQVSGELAENQNNVESTIKILRRLAEDCGFHRDDCIIISRPTCTSTNVHGTDTTTFEGHWEITSAIALPRFTGKHSQDGTLRATERNVRWVHVDRTKDPFMQRYLDCLEIEDPSEDPGGVLGLPAEELQSVCRCAENDLQCGRQCSCRLQGHKCTSICQCVSYFTGSEESLRCSNIRSCRTESDSLDEDCFWLSLRGTLDIDDWSSPQERRFQWHDPPEPFVRRYENLQNSPSMDLWNILDFGDGETSLEFGPGNPQGSYRVNLVARDIKYRPVQVSQRVGLYLSDRAPIDISSFSLPKLTEVFRSGVISRSLLRQFLAEVPRKGVPDYSHSLDGALKRGEVFFTSLKAMAAISELYCDWPDATVLISVTKKTLGLTHWAASLEEKMPVWTTPADKNKTLQFRSRKFACLAMLESGVHDLHPDQLELVMALAAGNSIYAAESLLQDPSREDSSGHLGFKGIRRILGNVGHPGVVLIIPPPSPLVLRPDPRRARYVHADTFDGELRDSFEQTSLHLRFTNLKVPLAIARGAIDADVVFLEALVSVFDGPRWIADLDILKSLETPDLIRLHGCECENREKSRNLGKHLANNLGARLKSISKWDELLICKENLLAHEVGVVRSYSNWFARLAATALAASIGCPTVVLPSHYICSDCGQKLAQRCPHIPSTTNNFPTILIT